MTLVRRVLAGPGAVEKITIYAVAFARLPPPGLPPTPAWHVEGTPRGALGETELAEGIPAESRFAIQLAVAAEFADQVPAAEHDVLVREVVRLALAARDAGGGDMSGWPGG